MKKNGLFFALLGVLLTLGLVFVGCDSGGGDGDGGNSVTYNSKDATGKTVEVTITKQVVSEPTSARAHTPQSGDTYVLRYNGLVVSQGTVAVAGTTVTFTSEKGKVFEGTTAGSKMTFTDETIPTDSGTDIPVPKGGSDVDAAGTWEGTVDGGDLGYSDDAPTYFRVVLANGKLTSYATCDFPKLTNRECGRGTYSVSGNTVTVTITQMLWVEWNGYGTVTTTQWHDAYEIQIWTITGGNTATTPWGTFTKTK